MINLSEGVNAKRLGFLSKLKRGPFRVFRSFAQVSGERK